MEQYHRLVCERREQAVRRNQALQRHARQACTSLAVPVDTSKLETLKSQYKLSVARLCPNWLNSHVSQTSPQDHGLPSPSLGQQKSLHLPQTGNVNTHYSTSTVSPSFPYQTCLSPHSSTRLPQTANTDPITHPTTVHTRPLTFPKPPAPVSTSTTLTQHQFQTTSAARPSTPPTAGYRSLPKSPVLVSDSLSSLPHLAPCPTLAPLCSSQSPTIPHYTDSTALLSQLTETTPSSCAPEQTPRQTTAATVPPQHPPTTDAVGENHVPSQPSNITVDVAHRPHNVLVLSAEDSDSSLSLTPPPVLLDIEKLQPVNHDSNGALTFSNAEQTPLPLFSGNGTPDQSSGSQPVGQTISHTTSSEDSGNREMNQHPPQEQRLSVGEQIQKAVGESSNEGKNSSTPNESVREMELSGLEAVTTDGVKETRGVTDNPGLPTDDKVKESFPLEKSERSNSFGDEGDLPLPQEILLPPPAAVPGPQRDGGGSISESESLSTESGGGEGGGVVGGHRASSGSGGQASEHREPQTQPNNGADVAYASFLQSVCQTTGLTAAAPLLDSDSEGIEDAALEGLGRDPEPHSHPSLSPTSLSTGRATESCGLEPAERKPKSIPEVGSDQVKGEGQLDASGSDSSLSPHKPSYTPSVIERQHRAESKTLQKRHGFWGSDDSTLDNSGIEPPTAEDDHGDFDFYM